MGKGAKSAPCPPFSTVIVESRCGLDADGSLPTLRLRKIRGLAAPMWGNGAASPLAGARPEGEVSTSRRANSLVAARRAKVQSYCVRVETQAGPHHHREVTTRGPALYVQVGCRRSMDDRRQPCAARGNTSRNSHGAGLEIGARALRSRGSRGGVGWCGWQTVGGVRDFCCKG